MTTRRKSTASTAVSKKPVARKSPAKPASEEENTLDFARAIALAVQTNLVTIQKSPVGKKQLPPTRLVAFKKQISAASTAMTTHQLQKVGAKGATANEATLRADLIDQVTTVRDAVSALAGVDRETARAFGVGARLQRTVNGDALLVASQQQQAFANEKYETKAVEAGVTAQQIASIMVARRALSAAASTQATARTGKTGLGLDKASMIKALSKETTAIRKIAKIVFKRNVKVLASFAPAPKKRVTKRKPKPATPAPTVAAPASNGSVAVSNQAKV